jgi:UDP-glucose 4-epimerase
MNGASVLVTGGLGFIGSNLAIACRARGARVTVLDSLHPEAGGSHANLAGVDGVAVVPADLGDADAVAACVRGADLVFHCAALTSHAGSMSDPLETERVNVAGTLTLLEAVRRLAPEARLVHVGTSTQVGRMRRSPIDEDHPEFPLDVYSASKTAAEKYVLLYASAHGLRTAVIRLGNVYGPRAHIRSPRFGFLGYFIGLALQGKTISVFGDGSQLRSVTYVDDAVDALLLAAARDEASGQPLFAVAEERHRLAEIAARIAAVIGGRVEQVPWPAGRESLEVGDAVISAARIRERLGWSARVGLDAGLTTTADYYRGRLQDYL